MLKAYEANQFIQVNLNVYLLSNINKKPKKNTIKILNYTLKRIHNSSYKHEVMDDYYS